MFGDFRVLATILVRVDFRQLQEHRVVGFHLNKRVAGEVDEGRAAGSGVARVGLNEFRASFGVFLACSLEQVIFV